MSRKQRKMKDVDFCDKLCAFIEKNPSRCDVTFLVGPEKEVVRTLRAILEVSSPVFTDLFTQCWDPLEAKPEADTDGEPIRGIPLPDLDPQAFKIFHKLLISHDVSTEKLLNFKMSAELLLNLMEICHRFQMNTILHQLRVLAEKTLFSDLTRFIRSEDFLHLSQPNMRTILTRDEILMDEAEIYDVACKWSEVQCSRAGLENSAENVRRILGDSLFQIRFPIMSYKDFGRIIRSKNILTAEEQIEIFKYISMDEEETVHYNVGKIGFIAKKRSLLYGPTVALLKNFRAVSQPPFVCDGKTCVNYLQVDQKVYVTAFGFLGPIESDAFYEVHMEILRYNSNYSSFSCGKVERKVWAKERQIFHVKFEEPILIESTHTNETIWNDYYGVRFSLKGPPTCSLELKNADGVKKTTHRFKAEADSDSVGVGFYCQWGCNPLVELQFRKYL